jgi:hypothetical protein
VRRHTELQEGITPEQGKGKKERTKKEGGRGVMASSRTFGKSGAEVWKCVQG